jgi:hypothetical protein
MTSFLASKKLDIFGVMEELEKRQGMAPLLEQELIESFHFDDDDASVILSRSEEEEEEKQEVP